MRQVIATVLVAVVLAACGTSSDGSGDESSSPGSAVVERIVDGDTIRVRIDGDEETVRLIGIDTPETVDPRRPVQCFGKEASAHLTSTIPPGTEVILVRDAEARDRYGRLLAYVYRASDDLFVNLALARDGYAQVATFPPNVAHTDAFLEAASEARRQGRGLWAACDPDE